jgi:hypothetical protein
MHSPSPTPPQQPSPAPQQRNPTSSPRCSASPSQPTRPRVLALWLALEFTCAAARRSSVARQRSKLARTLQQQQRKHYEFPPPPPSLQGQCSPRVLASHSRKIDLGVRHRLAQLVRHALQVTVRDLARVIVVEQVQHLLDVLAGVFVLPERRLKPIKKVKSGQVRSCQAQGPGQHSYVCGRGEQGHRGGRGHGADGRVAERTRRGGAAPSRAPGRRGQQERGRRRHGADSRVRERSCRAGAASAREQGRRCEQERFRRHNAFPGNKIRFFFRSFAGLGGAKSKPAWAVPGRCGRGPAARWGRRALERLP